MFICNIRTLGGSGLFGWKHVHYLSIYQDTECRHAAKWLLLRDFQMQRYS